MRKAKGQPWRLSIATALSLVFGGLLTVAVLAVGGITWRANEINTLELLGETSELYLDSVADRTQDHLAAGLAQARHIARLVRDGDLDLSDQAQLEAVMAGSLAAGKQLRGVAVVRADGMATRVGYPGDSLGRFRSDWSERPEIRELLKNAKSGAIDEGAYVVVWADDLKAPHVSASLPLVGPDGEFLGAVSSVIAISAISEFVAGLTDQEEMRAFVLLGHDRVLAHPQMAKQLAELTAEHPLPRLDTLSDPVLSAIWDSPLVDDTVAEVLAGRNAEGHIVHIEGREYVFLYRPLGRIGDEAVEVGIYTPTDMHDRPLERLAGSAAVGLLILLIAIAVAVLLGRTLAKPIRRLEAAADAVSRLRLEEMPAPQVTRLRELDAAQRTFATMRDALGWFSTYVPRSLVFRLMSLGPEAAVSVEREVSVLFTDIVGFTQLSERQSPEEMAALLNEHFALLAACVEAEGGTVDKYIGDSLMAFWGAPDEQPDHAARAGRAARAMAFAVAADNARRRAAGLPPVRLRIGLHSGPAVVGNIGAPGRMNYTLIGDTVNVAQRLEALGKEFGGGREVEVLASLETVAAGGLHGESLGAVPLRGRDHPVEVQRLCT
jgi:class 3 adenylate cyclase